MPLSIDDSNALTLLGRHTVVTKLELLRVKPKVRAFSNRSHRLSSKLAVRSQAETLTNIHHPYLRMSPIGKHMQLQAVKLISVAICLVIYLL